MKRFVAIIMVVSLLCCLFVGTAYAAEETTGAASAEETTAAVEETVAAEEEAPAAEEAAPAEESVAASEEAAVASEGGADASEVVAEEESEGGMGALKVILLVMQIISSLALTAVILFQSSKESGLGALSGNTDNYMGKKNAGTLDAKLASITKWIAAGFILLTLFVSMLYTAV